MTQETAADPADGSLAVFSPDLVAMRELLTLVSLARVALARRLAMSLHDLEVMEHLLLGGPAEPLGPAELSRRIGVSTAAATQSVNRLEAAGHLTRRPHPADRRRQTLDVTPAGSQQVMGALGPLLGLLEENSQRLTEPERRIVTRHLRDEADAYRTFLTLVD